MGIILAQCFSLNSENTVQFHNVSEKPEGKILQDNQEFVSNFKLSSLLNRLIAIYQRGEMSEVEVFAKNHNIILEDNQIQVTIVTNEEAIDDIRTAVKACGGEYQLHYRYLLQAMVPLGSLEALSQRQDIKVIREPQRAILHE
jgi:hypothetical protein